MSARKKAETVSLNVDIDKLLRAIGYLIACAVESGHSVTQYDIVKSLFLADKSHLNKYGRLITDDNYYAMPHGPVPTFGYDLLKLDENAVNALNGREIPWSQDALERGKFSYHSCTLTDFDEYLSDSDKEALEWAYATVKRLGFAQVRQLTHEDPAYVEAWEDDSQLNSFPMSLALMFDSPNFEKAQEISDLTAIKNT